MLMTYILSCALCFAWQQPPATEKQQDKPAEKDQLKLTIEGDVTKELIPVAGKLTELFYEVTPSCSNDSRTRANLLHDISASSLIANSKSLLIVQAAGLSWGSIG